MDYIFSSYIKNAVKKQFWFESFLVVFVFILILLELKKWTGNPWMLIHCIIARTLYPVFNHPVSPDHLYFILLAKRMFLSTDFFSRVLFKNHVKHRSPYNMSSWIWWKIKFNRMPCDSQWNYSCRHFRYWQWKDSNFCTQC